MIRSTANQPATLWLVQPCFAGGLWIINHVGINTRYALRNRSATTIDAQLAKKPFRGQSTSKTSAETAVF